MTHDHSARNSLPGGGSTARRAHLEAENEPFLLPSDLTAAAAPQRQRSLRDGEGSATGSNSSRTRRARSSDAAHPTARLFDALPPRWSQWLHPSSTHEHEQPEHHHRRRRAPPPPLSPRGDGSTAAPTLRVPVTLRALPGNAPRGAAVPRHSSLQEIRIDTHRDDNDNEEGEGALPALVSLTDVELAVSPSARHPGGVDPMPTQQQHEVSPVGSPRSTASSDDSQSEAEVSMLDEFHTLLRRCHHTLPFIALFVLYVVYQHVVGLAVFALGSVAIAGLDQRLRAQIALKENANRLYLLGIIAICMVDTIVISSLDGEPNPVKHLTFKLHAANNQDNGDAETKETSHGGAQILELLWIVLVNDFIVRFWSLAVKALVAVVPADATLFEWRRGAVSNSNGGNTGSLGNPEQDLEDGQRHKLSRSNVAFYRRKRKLYGIIELTSIFFRSLVAGLPWCSYYQLCSSKFMADVFTFLYVFGKSVILGSQGRRLIKLVRSFLTLGLEHATYVTRDELAEAGCPDCSICYENMQTPVKLSCSHLFCEECVMEWFDRERSCPLCRAAIVPASQADSEPKPQFLDGSTSLFPQLF